MQEDERYLGGFYSPTQLTIGNKFSVGGGIFATDKRLLIFRMQPPLLDKIAKGADSGAFVPTNLTKEQNDAIIAKLLEYKELDMRKDSISQFEIKKPPGMFRTGHLMIKTLSGEELKIGIGKSKQYEWLLRIIQQFDPQHVQLV